MKLLFISSWFPYPPTNGSELRIFNLFQRLTAAHEVTLVSFVRRPIRPNDLAHVETMASAVHLVDWKAFETNSLQAILGYFSPKPRSVLSMYSAEMAELVAHLITDGAYDLIVASQFYSALYVPENTTVPAIFEEVEAATLYEQTAQATGLGQLRAQLMWTKHSRYLRQLLSRFVAATVASEQEKTLLSQIAPEYDAVEIIPNCMALDDYDVTRLAPIPSRLIFTGSFTYHVNYAAMCWFLEHVYPHVLAEMPDVQVVITGDHAGMPLPTMHNVVLTGMVDDVKAEISSSMISLAPILEGGGTRLKILEAMALGVPVVSTSKGAEGLDVRVGQDILIADDPAEFGRNIVTLLQDQALWQTLSTHGRRLVDEQYNWDSVYPRFETLLRKSANLRPEYG
jgi:glycosyltransferase involved in cell wall biosynthesis